MTVAYPTSDTEIRTTAITALVDAGVVGGRVEDSRSAPYGPDETYPRLTVSIPSSQADNRSIASPHIVRTSSLVVGGVVRVPLAADDTAAEGAAALAAALDTLEGQVLAALVPWAERFDRVSLREIAKGRTDEITAYMGQLAIVLECEWHQVIAYPAIPDSLTAIGIDLDLYVPSGGPADRIEASRLVDLTE